MPECKDPLQEELKAYLDGELPPARRAAVERHLASCPACQAERTALQQLSTQLTQALPVAEPLPEALRARILAALPGQPEPRPLLVPFWRRPGPLATFGLGGALAMACAFWLWLRVPAPTPPLQATLAGGAEQAKASAPAASVASSAVEPEQERVPKLRVAAKQAVAANAPAERPEPPRPNTVLESAAPVAPSVSVTRATGRAVSLPKAVLSTELQQATAPANQPQFDASEAKKDKAMALAPEAPAAAKPQARGAMTRWVRESSAYTLTVASGKRTQTLEALRKLADELKVTLAGEAPTLELELDPESRAALLERLQALGKLKERGTPPGQAERSDGPAFGRGGFGGGGGGAARISSKLRLSLQLVELEPEELP